MKALDEAPDRSKPVEHQYWRDLYRDVVLTGLCTGCAGCVVVCPFKVLGYDHLTPMMLHGPSAPDDCVHGQKSCDLCVRACPRIGYEAEAVEQLLFGRTKKPEEISGVATRIVLARASDPALVDAGQDGGVVSALLIWALEQGMIDGALVAGMDENAVDSYGAIARTREEVLKGAFSRYTYVPTPLPMTQAVADGLKSLALVGVACQTEFARKIITTGVKKYNQRIFMVLGLLCSETFEYGPFIEQKIHGELRIPIEDITKINVKGKVLVYRRSGEVVDIPLKECRPMAREHCHHCPDFSAEHADISFGGLGMEGWTLTLVRTPRGEQIWQQALDAGVIEDRPGTEEPRVLELLEKLSARQRARPVRRGDTWYRRAAEESPAVSPG